VTNGAKPPKVSTSPLISITRPKFETFEAQMELVSSYAMLRRDRAAEIVAQLPPPFAFFASIGFMDGSRTPHTLELLATAGHFSTIITMFFKYALSAKRPIELSPQVQPMIATPTHGALPSGHATEAFLMARLLLKIQKASGAEQYKDPAWAEMLMRQASRVAINRTVAGVHYPADSAAGAILGLTLASFFEERCQKEQKNRQSAAFHGNHFPGGADFNWNDLFDAERDKMHKHAGAKGAHWMTSANGKAPQGATEARPLNWLWNKAVAEWAELDGKGTAA
jgi:hypothetical protein